MKNRRLLAGLTAMTLVLGGAFVPFSGTSMRAAALWDDGNGFVCGTEYEYVDDICYFCRENDDGSITIRTIECDGDMPEDLVIPEKLRDMKVTGIGSHVFSYDRPKTLTIPDSVTDIHENAFENCIVLEKVTLPKNLEEIKKGTFSGCENLKEIVIPAGVTLIGEGAFRDCTSLEKVTIPGSVENISSKAFTGCSSLKSIRIPESVAQIGSKAIGFDNEGNKYEDFVIEGALNSTAEFYAGLFGITFAEMSDEDINDDITTDEETTDTETTETTDTETTADESFMHGDVNGDGRITVTDLSKVAAHIKTVKLLTEDEHKRAEVSGDGKITVTDLSKIAAHIKSVKKLG